MSYAQDLELCGDPTRRTWMKVNLARFAFRLLLISEASYNEMWSISFKRATDILTEEMNRKV